jgi:CSLREA domain-containing protein
MLWGGGEGAHAASFTVNSTADAVDASPGDGSCNAGGGQCTLRAAIQETNALPGADTITLPAGDYVLTVAGFDEDAAATGDLDITDDVDIVGAGPDATVIDGNQLDGILENHGNAVHVAGVDLQNGDTVYWGGAISSYGELVVTDSIAEDNAAGEVGGTMS